MAKASFVATIVFSCLFVLVGEASRGMVIGSLSTYLTQCVSYASFHHVFTPFSRKNVL